MQGWLDALGIAVVDRTKVGGTDALVGGNYLTLIDPSIRPTRLAMLERAQGVAVGRGVQHVIVFTLAGVADAAAKFVIDADVAVFEVGYDGSATAASPRAQRLATQAWRSGERAASTPAKPPAGPCCDWCEEEAELSALTEVEGQLLCGDCLDQGLWDEEIHRCPLCDTVVAKLVTVRHTKSRHEITSCRACVGSKAARRALATEVSAGGRPCAQCKRMFFSPLLSRDHPDEPNEWCRDCIDTSFDVCDHCGDRTADGTVFTRGSVSVLVCEDCSPAAGQILHDAVLDAINDPDEEFWDDEPSDDADDEDLDLSWDLLDDP